MVKRIYLQSASMLAAASVPAYAGSPSLPSGGHFALGTGQITTNQSQLTISQSGARGVINWNTFSVGVGNKVQFNNGTGATLNMVTGSTPSSIAGSVTASGSVYLVNPQGVIVTPAGTIKTGGAFVASSRSANPNTFMSTGALQLQGTTQTDVANLGTIKSGADTVLVGRNATNAGTIQAGGTATLVAADDLVLQQEGDNLRVAVNTGSGNVRNTGGITAAEVSLNAAGGDVYALAGKPGGYIHATGTTTQNGRVLLTANGKAEVSGTVTTNSGTIIASGKTVTIDSTARLRANGTTSAGTITVTGGSGGVQVGGQISASSRTGAGGSISIIGQTVALGSSARLAAKGAIRGGTVKIGSKDTTTTTAITVAAGAVIDASATKNGDGGSISIISNLTNPASTTSVHGTLIAAGGPDGGNGGVIETSGATLDTTGSIVQAPAPHGVPGQWLLDPTMVEITDTRNPSGTKSSPSDNTLTIAGSNVSYVLPATIENALNSGTSVQVETSGLANSGAFDLYLLSPILKSAGGLASLTLQAANTVFVGAPITSTSGALNVNLHAGNNLGTLTGTGAIILAANITTNGGNITFGTNQTYTSRTNGVTQLAGGDVYVNSQMTATGLSSGPSTTVTLDTRSANTGGGINFYGQLQIANPAGLTINTFHTGSGTGVDGNVTFAGTVDSGNSFQLVQANLDWAHAYLAAQSGSGANVGDTYLATMPTSLLNAVASFSAQYSAAWFGALRPVASTPTGSPTSSGPGATALDNIWYWVTGPLGLVVNRVSPTGHGTAFFVQNGSTTYDGSGGTPIIGAYNDWNPGEPNNSRGGNLTPSGAVEWAGQFTGSAGLWNDLSRSGSPLPYLKETNLAASPLAINAGQGILTFGAGIGTIGPISSIQATAKVLNLPHNPQINTLYGATFNVGQTNVANGDGIYVPTTLLTIAEARESQTYGQTAGALPITYTVQGDSTSSAPPSGVSPATQSWAVTPTSSSDVGIYTSTVSGASWTGPGVDPYTFIYVNGNLTINPALVSVAGITAVSRPYNGTLTVSITGTPTLTGLIGSDRGTLSGTASTGTVANPNVQLANGVPQPESVTLSQSFSFSLTSGNPSDYAFVQPALSATITPAPLTVTGLTPLAKVYDGTPTIALTGTPTIHDLVNNETLTLPAQLPAGIAASPNAGVQPVTTDLTLANGTGLASNYVLEPPVIGPVTISSKPLTWSVADAVSTYGTIATPGAAALNGVVLGDTITPQVKVTQNASPVTLAFNSAAGAYQESVTGLTGAASTNYILASTGNTLGTLTINPKALTWSVADAVSTYGTIATPGAAALNGVVLGDTITPQVKVTQNASPVTLAFNSAAGAYQESVTGLTGAASTNYILASTGNTLGTLTINPKALTWSVADAVSTYGTIATPGAAALNGVVLGDTITPQVKVTQNASPVTLAFNSAAGAYQESVTGLTGAASTNYILASTGNTLGTLTINPKALTWSVADAVSTYGTIATPGAAALNGAVLGDTITPQVKVTQNASPVTLAFNSAAGAYQESVTGLTGAASTNYILASTGNTLGTLTINPKALTWSVADAVSTYGTIATPGAAALNGAVLGDTITPQVKVTQNASPVTLAFNSAAGAYQESVTGLTGAASTNYILASTGNTLGTLTINPKALTWSVADAVSTYGTIATPGAAALNGAVLGDTITPQVKVTQNASPVTLAFNSAAGAYQESVTGLTGAASTNYILASTGNTLGTLTINPKALTWSVADAVSTYGTIATPGAAALNGVVLGDTITPQVKVTQNASPVTLAFNSAAGAYQESVTGLTGAASTNYILASTGNTLGTLTINPKALTWSVADAVSTYGTIATPGAAALNGAVLGDTITPQVKVTQNASPVTLAFNSAAGAYQESVTGLTGAASTNYILASTGNTLGTLTINPKALTWSVADAVSTYGTIATPGAAALNGAVLGDTITPQVKVTQNASPVTLAFNSAAGAYQESVTGLTGAASTNYILASTGNTLGTLTINPKALTWSVADAVSTYGTIATPGAAALNGAVLGDTITPQVKVTQNASPVTLAFNSAAGAYQESVTGLTGAASTNYILASTGNTLGTLTINPKALTWSVADAVSTYGTIATPGAAALNGVVLGDTITPQVKVTQNASPVTLAFNSAAGAYQESVTGLTGAASTNYILASTGNTLGTLTINPKALTWSVADTQTTYGSKLPLGAVSLTGLVANDSVIPAISVFESAGNMITAASVAVGTYQERVTSLSGLPAANYVLASSGNRPGNLVVRPLPTLKIPPLQPPGFLQAAFSLPPSNETEATVNSPPVPSLVPSAAPAVQTPAQSNAVVNPVQTQVQTPQATESTDSVPQQTNADPIVIANRTDTTADNTTTASEGASPADAGPLDQLSGSADVDRAAASGIATKAEAQLAFNATANRSLGHGASPAKAASAARQALVQLSLASNRSGKPSAAQRLGDGLAAGKVAVNLAGLGKSLKQGLNPEAALARAAAREQMTAAMLSAATVSQSAADRAASALSQGLTGDQKGDVSMITALRAGRDAASALAIAARAKAMREAMEQAAAVPLSQNQHQVVSLAAGDAGQLSPAALSALARRKGAEEAAADAERARQQLENERLQSKTPSTDPNGATMAQGNLPADTVLRLRNGAIVLKPDTTASQLAAAAVTEAPADAIVALSAGKLPAGVAPIPALSKEVAKRLRHGETLADAINHSVAALSAEAASETADTGNQDTLNAGLANGHLDPSYLASLAGGSDLRIFVKNFGNALQRGLSPWNALPSPNRSTRPSEHEITGQ